MSSDAKEHIRDKLPCRSNGAVAPARPRESADIFPSRVSVYLSAFTFLSVVFIDFFCLAFVWFLRQGRVFVGSSIVVPPVFPFFSPCLSCPFVFCFLSHQEKAELKINYN